MTEKLQIYKCDICGNIVSILHKGADALVCCGKPMILKKENTTDAVTEKHVPIIEKVEGGILVKIGEVAHPMTNDHFIEWIQVIADNKEYTEFLSPEKKPEAFFPITDNNIIVKEYCNLHGLWKA